MKKPKFACMYGLYDRITGMVHDRIMCLGFVEYRIGLFDKYFDVALRRETERRRFGVQLNRRINGDP